MTMGLVDRGSEISTDLLATELAKNHEVLVIQSGPVTKKSYSVKRVYPLKAAPPVSPKNIVDKLLFRLHLDKESGSVIEFTQSAIPIIKNYDPDIIIATNGSIQLQLLMRMTLKAKIVVFGRAGIGHHDLSTLKQSPDLFIALSKVAESWALNIANKRTKVVYIPNPINATKASKINLKLPSPVVLCVGALSKYKNIDKVIEAISKTLSSLLLIGDGEESINIGKSLSTLAEHFRWIHHVESPELPKLYGSSDVFCFVPDPQEAFGRVYLEAMAAGLPIVASDDPIRRDLIGEKGIYVDPHNVGEIVRGINKAIQMDKIDYSKELESFKLKAVVKQIEKEFHDLIK